MVEEINTINESFEILNLRKLKDLIVLSCTTSNNNTRQLYFYELLDLGN